MRWTVHGERDLYESPWVRLSLVDVEVPGHRRYEHHVVHAADAAGTLVHDPDRGVLLLWRHRFLAGEWGWEIPGGLVDDGESPEDAARRECIEESGWEPGPLRASYRFRPSAGLSTQTFHVFTATTAEQVGDPDPTEAERVDWLHLDAVRAAVRDNRFHDAMSVIAVLQLLARS